MKAANAVTDTLRAEAPAAGTMCPKCQKPLTDPSGLGWCPACGYCRSLEEMREQAPAAAPQAAKPKHQGGFLEFCGYVVALPRWFWILLGGIVLFAGFSFVIGKYLKMTEFERALVCTLQIAAGLGLILTAQFLALVRLVPEDERLSTKDAILPAKLWAMAFQRMPAFRVPVWLAGWGLTIAVSAIFLVGGLTHWMKYLPGQKPDGKTPTQSTSRR